MFPRFGMSPRTPEKNPSQDYETRKQPGQLFGMIKLKCPSCSSFQVRPTDGESVKCLDCNYEFNYDEFQAQISVGARVGTLLEEHPEYAAALGRIAAASTAIEGALCSIAGFLMRAPPWHAHVAFFSIASNRSRIDMVKALATHMLGESQFRAPLDSLLGKAGTLAKKRNKYVHANWAKSTDGSKVYLLEQASSPSKSTHREVFLDELIAVFDETVLLKEELETFCGDYSAAYPLHVYEGENSIIPDALRKRSYEPEMGK